MYTNKQAQITLVGAGPGDPKLLTRKGLEALREADVILFDALVNEALLDEAPQAKAIYVGKRKGDKSYSQEEINKLMVNQALNYGKVVRLKGGDSFVFGRGYEEVEYANLFGIPVSVIPGVSSSIAAPALAGIPVTHRGASNGFFVLTAVLADGTLNPELKLAVQTNATVVILMGLSQLKYIADLYLEQGRNDQAFAIISKASLPEQESLYGTAESIVKQQESAGLKAPAVIVIGKVVEYVNFSLSSLHCSNLN